MIHKGANILILLAHQDDETIGSVKIHTGLVEHYRGVDSTLWALYNNNTDLIGATLHYIDDSIDGGNIIDTAKIKIKKHDNLDKLFYKTLVRVVLA